MTQVTEGDSITSFSYDGDGGRVKKSTVHSQQSTETTYVGSLFEIQSTANSPQTTVKHIFAGANRVATVSLRGALSQAKGDEAISYYHPDHLGSSNVITDQDGNLAQYCEYEPYGTFARNSVIASPEGAKQSPVSHYFTGKELDSTGLYYYGARYYDPEIGRFITADPTIQRPYDPQDLNRYAYCRNNPVNLIDPSGLGWFKKFIQKWAGLFGAVGGLVKGVVTGDWSTLQNMGTALGTSAILSWGNPFAIAASVAAAGFMDTPPGQQFGRFMSEDVFDDAFGMRPRAAYIVGNMVATAIVASAIYIAITPSTYSGPDYRKVENRAEIEKYGADVTKSGNGGSGVNQMRAKGGRVTPYREGEVASLNGWEDVPLVREVTKALKINHTAAVVKTSKGLFDSALDSDLINPFKTGDLFGMPWTGTCQQVTFKTLVENGMSGIGALGAMTQHGGWTFYVTSSIYGVRADFGGVGAINAISERSSKN